MDYSFFNYSSAKQRVLLKVVTPLNKLFDKLKLNIEIVRKPYNSEMITVEQRINLFHLANEMLVHNVEGDFIELGCHTGNSALQIQAILEKYNSGKVFFVYDAFNLATDPVNNHKEMFVNNFKKSNFKIPVIHEGFFSETIPGALPDKISFAHIDCTVGHNQEVITKDVLHLLEHIYPRMTPRAVCLIMDYYDENKTTGSSNSYPGVKAACDLFFQNRPEKVFVLFGNHFSHGYFRKQ